MNGKTRNYNKPLKKANKKERPKILAIFPF